VANIKGICHIAEVIIVPVCVEIIPHFTSLMKTYKTTHVNLLKLQTHLTNPRASQAVLFVVQLTAT
jgi:hypothetical protein